MKFLWLALSLIVILAGPSPAQNWSPVPVGTSSDIRGIDDGFIFWWVVGSNGLVSESNGSKTAWTPVNLGTNEDFYSVLQPSFGQVWAAGSHGTVRVLIYGTWYVRDIPNHSEGFHLYTSGSYDATAVGSGGSIYATTDGGLSWVSRNSGTNASLSPFDVWHQFDVSSGVDAGM